MKTLSPFFCLVIVTQILFSCAPDKQSYSDPVMSIALDTIPEKMGSKIILPPQTNIITPKKNKASQLSKATLYQQLENPAQRFLVSSTKDTLLTGSQGTKLSIKKSSFLLNGTPYEGGVALRLKECYSYEDMILNNLSTHSNDRILESGGMIHLEAFTDDHQKLTLDSNQPIGLQMPSDGPKQYMQLFYADKNMNWLQASDSKPQFAKVTNNKKSRSSGIRSGNYFVSSDGFGTITTTICIIKDGKEIQLSSTSYANSEMYQYVYDSLKVSFEINEYGSILNSTLLDTTLSRVYTTTPFQLESMTDSKLTYNHYNPRNARTTDCNILLQCDTKKRGYPEDFYFIISRPVHNMIKKNIARYGTTKVLVKNTYTFISRGGGSRDRIKDIQATLDSSDGSVKDISAQDLQYYAFSINQLGWINCDRFYNVPASQKTNFTIANQEGVDLKLVFSDMKSVLTGYRTDDKVVFNNVPKNKAVTLVGIRIVNDKAELAILKTITLESCQEPLVYTPVSVEELKEKIKDVL